MEEHHTVGPNRLRAQERVAAASEVFPFKLCSLFAVNEVPQESRYLVVASDDYGREGPQLFNRPDVLVEVLNGRTPHHAQNELVERAQDAPTVRNDGDASHKCLDGPTPVDLFNDHFDIA
jgi:hypothetical protein